jgi:hypothetical protein
MTTDRQMKTKYAAEREVILAPHSIGKRNLAGRPESCAAVGRERHHGDGWPRICRSAACVWCR